MTQHETRALLAERGFRNYLACLAAFWLPGGMLAVLFPWLVAVWLAAPPQRLGVAQMALQLPTLMLVLFGGVLADRLDPRRILIAVHLLAPVAPLALAMVLWAERGSFSVLIVYALAVGTLSALALPARDSLLTQVAGSHIQRAVGLTMGVQFGVQIAGFGLAGLADRIGPEPLLLLMVILLASGLLAARALPPRTHPVAAAAGSRLSELAGGITASLRSPALWPAMLLAFGTGIFYAGSYVVLLPLFVRDVYAGSAGAIGITFTCFMLGTLTAIMLLVRAPAISRPGRALLCSQWAGAAVLALLALGLPLPGFLFVIFLWGICGGIGMVTSRSIVQAAAPASHRGRVLSVYSLTNFGGMPLGSLLLGYLIAGLGPLTAALIPALAMLILTTTVALTSPLWRQRET